MTLRTVGASFGYRGRAIVRDVSLALAPGTVVGLVGPNGAGKSTLLRGLSGLLPPLLGAVEFDGAPLSALSASARARRIGFLPQSSVPALPTTVAHYVGLGRFARGARSAAARDADAAAVAGALADFGLTEFAARRVDELSGGEFRRAVAAQVFAQEPDVLLLDEPVRELDLRHQVALLRLVRERTVLRGGLCALVLHDLSFAWRFCDRVALVVGGRVVAEGPPAEALTAAALRDAYGVEVALIPYPAAGGTQVVPLRPCVDDPSESLL